VPLSPNVQLYVKVPTPPVAFAVKITGEVASGDVGLRLYITAGAEAILTL